MNQEILLFVGIREFILACACLQLDMNCDKWQMEERQPIVLRCILTMPEAKESSDANSIQEDFIFVIGLSPKIDPELIEQGTRVCVD